MIRALFTSATGMKAQETVVDVIANNIANVNTVGFKRSRANFQDLLYVSLSKPGDSAQGIQSPTGFEIGNGVRTVSTTKVFSPGPSEGTQRELDVAIQGDGFFQVLLPDGGPAYTRDGALHIDSQLNLVTSQGYLLQPQITLPSNLASVSIGPDGLMMATTTDAPDAPQQIGQLTLSRFPNPAGLESLGSNLLRASPASGAAIETTPGTDGTGTIAQGFLERSNVDVVTELVNMIVAQRAYEVNSRAIRTGDDMLSQVNSLVR